MPPQQVTQDDSDLFNIPGYYLATMGDKFNVHFTMEYLQGADTFAEATDEPLDPSVGTIDELIKEIEKIPDARVILNRADKDHPLLHLIDKQLGKKTEVLDRKIDLRYSGLAKDIATELEKRGVPGIEERRSAGSSEFYDDYVTRVDIDAKQQPIRDILTHCVDLEKYSRLIWKAKTYKDGTGAWKTQILFSGPLETP